MITDGHAKEEQEYIDTGSVGRFAENGNGKRYKQPYCHVGKEIAKIQIIKDRFIKSSAVQPFRYIAQCYPEYCYQYGIGYSAP